MLLLLYSLQRLKDQIHGRVCAFFSSVFLFLLRVLFLSSVQSGWPL